MAFGLKMRGRKALAVTVALGAALALAGCSKDKDLEYKEQSVYEIYSQALGYLDDGQYKQAAQYFDEVERQHPYSVWATKAKLMAAYAMYQNNKYDDAISGLDRFIAVHPGNRDVAYAYYLKALCYYEQIADVQRDQDLTKKALDALQDVITRFPSTVYARDARLKMDLTRDHLAGKEMSVGRFYERRVQFLAAINRYRVVVDEYGDTSHSPEALERLSECFMALGLVDEARKAASVLGYNYPGSDWYKDAYTRVEGVPPKPGKEFDAKKLAASLAAESAAAASKGPSAGPSATAQTPGVAPRVPTPAAPEAVPDVGAAPPPPPPPPPAEAVAPGAPVTPQAQAPAPAKPDAEKPAEEKPAKEKLPWWKLW